MTTHWLTYSLTYLFTLVIPRGAFAPKNMKKHLFAYNYKYSVLSMGIQYGVSLLLSQNTDETLDVLSDKDWTE